MSTMYDTIQWRKLKYPAPWRPSPGDELVGYYRGTVQRNGRFGEYTALLVGVPASLAVVDTYMVSGCRAIQAVQASEILPGTVIRVVYGGLEMPDKDRSIRLLDVFAADGNPDLFACLDGGAE
jgi:hypothetical protein